MDINILSIKLNTQSQLCTASVTAKSSDASCILNRT